MEHFTLSSDDIKACIELAADGVNVHLSDQGKIDVIHKVMYAVAEAAQHNQKLIVDIEQNLPMDYALYLHKLNGA